MRLAAVISLVMAFGALSPFVIGALSPFIVPALSLSRSQLGLFMTVNFTVASLLSVPSGRLTDRISSRLIVSGLLAVAAVALLGMAMAPSLGLLLVLAVPSGMVQALANPVTNRLVALHASAQHRGLMLGLKQSAVHLGGFAAGIVLPFIAWRAGWRVAVGCAAAAGFLALWWSLGIVPRDEGRGTDEAAPATERFRWRDGTVLLLTLYAFLMGGGVAAVTAYMPLYAHERLAMDESTAGSVLAVFALTGVAARLLWGWVGDRVTNTPLALLALALGATAASLVLWQAESWAAWAIWGAAVGLGLTAAAWNAVGMLAVVRDFHTTRVGHATGMVSLGFYGGFIVSPTAFGALVDATDLYGTGWLAVVAHFVLAAFLALWWWLVRPTAAAASAPAER